MVVIGITLIFIVLFVVLMYNSLVNKKNQVENAFGGMDVQLKKRYDLIPNLISSVKTYMKHEKLLLLYKQVEDFYHLTNSNTIFQLKKSCYFLY